jgi:hypothetical protein
MLDDIYHFILEMQQTCSVFIFLNLVQKFPFDMEELKLFVREKIEMEMS